MMTDIIHRVGAQAPTKKSYEARVEQTCLTGWRLAAPDSRWKECPTKN
jgi:hypothetical protein